MTRAKNQLKASILYSQDGTTGAAEDLGRSLLVYNRRIARAELFARIDAVDAATVKEVANKFILDQDIAVATLGNTQCKCFFRHVYMYTFLCLLLDLND